MKLRLKWLFWALLLLAVISWAGWQWHARPAVFLYGYPVATSTDGRYLLFSGTKLGGSKGAWRLDTRWHTWRYIGHFNGAKECHCSLTPYEFLPRDQLDPIYHSPDGICGLEIIDRSRLRLYDIRNRHTPATLTLGKLPLDYVEEYLYWSPDSRHFGYSSSAGHYSLISPRVARLQKYLSDKLQIHLPYPCTHSRYVLRKTDGRVVATGPGEIAGWAGPHRIIVSYWDEPHWSGFIRIPKQFINEEITMIEWYYLLDLRTGKKHPLCRSYVFVDEGEH